MGVSLSSVVAALSPRAGTSPKAFGAGVSPPAGTSPKGFSASVSVCTTGTPTSETNPGTPISPSHFPAETRIDRAFEKDISAVCENANDDRGAPLKEVADTHIVVTM